MRGSTTIFKQLIFNVVVPAVIALIVLGIMNYRQTRSILVESNQSKNQIIFDEIFHVMEFQDMALNILEDDLNDRLQNLSNQLVNNYFSDPLDIENADLDKIASEIGLNPKLEDLYIINKDGVIINTTFSKDLGLNLYDFGLEHENYLRNVFEAGEFVSERFAIESSTRRLKKYSYQPTNDREYIIEIGIYSERADDIIQFIKNRLTDISRQQESIESVDLFIGADNPFSLVPDVNIIDEHKPVLQDVFATKKTRSVIEETRNSLLQYQYIYIDRKKTDLYKGSVVRIVSDRTAEKQVLRTELLKFIAIFGLTVISVIILIYRKTRVITDPIKRLVQKVNRITDGHLNERADVIGNNEITTLSKKFNTMIEQLESYYYELEEKVRERTAEIERQKEEIEAQRDSIEEQKNTLAEINENLQVAYTEIEAQKKHIEDSIHYAKRIQTAILPPDNLVNNLLPMSFILYLPKDIVSGDFYWIKKKMDKIMFAAVDCTGHGVPGAFMSIVGNNQLNYAVNVTGASTAAEILNDLNRGVTETLRQTRGAHSVKDGMDIALCVLEPATKTLHFAGAFNPLYIIRDGEILIYKPNKFPIGSFIEETLGLFNEHRIDLQSGDILYIFSDGFADQFGGENDRKYLSKRFRELLLEIHEQPMEEQKRLLYHAFCDWKGNNEQVDDILIIGVKIP
ncbi:MAG: SpoIIE family protein phosphatase [bacterium]